MKTTGIYCRPVCPAPSPKKIEHPLLRDGRSGRRGRLPTVPALPAGSSARHACVARHFGSRAARAAPDPGRRAGRDLRRCARRQASASARVICIALFTQHVGASPIAVAQTRRLHFAKRLLDETDLPITQIALAAGFGSLRRFNDAFQKTYQRSPRELRRLRRGSREQIAGDEVVAQARVSAAVRLGSCARLSGDARDSGRRTRRRTRLRKNRRDWTAGTRSSACVALEDADALELRVRGAAPAALFQISAAARRMFDLAADPARIAPAFRATRCSRRWSKRDRACAFPVRGIRSNAPCAPCSDSKSASRLRARSRRGSSRAPGGRSRTAPTA